MTDTYVEEGATQIQINTSVTLFITSSIETAEKKIVVGSYIILLYLLSTVSL